MQKKTMKLMMMTAVLVGLAGLLGNCGSDPAPRPTITTLYVKAGGTGSGESESDPLGALGNAIKIARRDRVANKIVVIGALEWDNGGYAYFGYNSLDHDIRPDTLSLTITGKPGATGAEQAVVRGNGKDRVFDIQGISGLGGVVNGYYTHIRLEHITITGGNAGDKDGGGILVHNNAVLTLGPGAVVTGNQAVNGGGVAVLKDGELSIEGGEIRDNTASNNGGGVYVYAIQSKLTMKSGKIDGNQAQNGGGVYVTEQTEFVLEGGEITNNIAVTSENLDLIAGDDSIWSKQSGYGGGIAAFNLSMKAGTISGNMVNGGRGQGGAITIRNADSTKAGTFLMEGGEITNNTSKTRIRGGVWDFDMFLAAVTIIGNFTMREGAIDNNPTGGIEIYPPSNGGNTSFIMEGGEIVGNGNEKITVTDKNLPLFAFGNPYGVSIRQVNWTMRGGTISGNQCGVSLTRTSFTMRGGEITNNSTNADYFPAAGILAGGSTLTIQGGKVSGNMVKGKEVNILEQK